MLDTLLVGYPGMLDTLLVGDPGMLDVKQRDCFPLATYSIRARTPNSSSQT
jgi:hypothetical protein